MKRLSLVLLVCFSMFSSPVAFSASNDEQQCLTGADPSACTRAAFFGSTSSMGFLLVRGCKLKDKTACAIENEDLVPLTKLCADKVSPSAEACGALGIKLSKDVDPKTKSIGSDMTTIAYNLALRRCKGGNGYHCGLASMFGAISGNDTNSQMSQLLEEACEKGEGYGCALRGALEMDKYLAGDKKLLLSAKALFKKGCDQGNDSSCVQLGAYYLSKGNLEDAAKAFQDTCLSGKAAACYRLGMTEQQLGNKDRALASFVLACKTGYGVACFHVSQLTENDTAKSLQFAQIGCSLHDGYSCNQAASIHYDLGNIVSSKSFADRGCDLSNPGACMRLGVILLGQKKNSRAFNVIKEGRKIAKTLCEAGDNESCGTLRKLASLGLKN